jgi:hypothetical protein
MAMRLQQKYRDAKVPVLNLTPFALSLLSALSEIETETAGIE